MRTRSICWVRLFFCIVCVGMFSLAAHAPLAHAQLPPIPGRIGPAQNNGGVLTGQPSHQGVGGPDQAGETNPQGGGSMADFDSLMTLIQQTIEPDSWEALGGVGTMAPYPQGVMVDPRGLLRDCPPGTTSRADHAAVISGLLAPPQSGDGDDPSDLANDWRSPAPIRCVSIRRMTQALATRSLHSQAQSTVSTTRSVSVSSGNMIDNAGDELAAFRAMAGLSKVTLAMVTSDDLILAGPVAGFDEINGWEIDRATGLPPMSLVSLAIGIKAARSGVPFGCTIDPTTEGLQAATGLGQQIASGRLPMAAAAEKLAAALGRQNIVIFGTTPSHEVALLMVEADRHMKQLALGTEPMPERVGNYLQLIETTGDRTPPTDLLLRLWFTSAAMDVRATDVDGDKIVQLAGVPIRLSGDNERAQLDGARGNHVIDDVSIAFVNHFNQNWNSIRSKYPVYGALQSLYMSTAIAELWKRTAITSDHETLQRAIMYFAAEQAEKLTSPTQIDSIAVLHRYRQGQKLHQVLMASGGVEIVPQALLPIKIGDYPGLQAYASLREQRPTNRWWWNGRAE